MNETKIPCIHECRSYHARPMYLVRCGCRLFTRGWWPGIFCRGACGQSDERLESVGDVGEWHDDCYAEGEAEKYSTWPESVCLGDEERERNSGGICGELA